MLPVLNLSVGDLLVLPVAFVAFIVLLTIIVFFHEYGHFSMARLLGVRVDVFSIGFGKTLAEWVDRHGTRWRVAMLPLGGYVKFFGDAGPASAASDEVQEEKAAEGGVGGTQFPRAEDAAHTMTDEEKAVCFHFKPVWARALIVAAGPIANFILAIAIFWGLFVTFGRGGYEPVIGKVLEESAAEEAGFAPGDRITAIGGKPVKRFTDLQFAVMLSAGEELIFEVERDGARVILEATPRRQESRDAFGNKIRTGILGVSPDAEGWRREQLGAGEALQASTAKLGSILSVTMRFLSRVVLGKEDASQLGGPIKMAQYAGQSVTTSFVGDDVPESATLTDKLIDALANFIHLAGVVSVSIGFLNLLPVPVLDGGHLMYYAYEALAGRPLGAKAQAIGFRVGLLVLASFMIFVTFNDINSLLFVGS